MKDQTLKALFESVETYVRSVALESMSPDKFIEATRPYMEARRSVLTDNDYYRLMVMIIFYSGFRAATVTQLKDVILQQFPHWEIVASFPPGKEDEIVSAPRMIKHRKKIMACIDNAKAFARIVDSYGSFGAFLNSFGDRNSAEAANKLHDRLTQEFSYLGQVTAYHFLTDCGFNVLKPDRVICRTFTRLGIIDREHDFAAAVSAGQRMAQATGQPIRYIDIVFMAHGQQSFPQFNIEKGICLNNPECGVCPIRSYCKYQANNRVESDA